MATLPIVSILTDIELSIKIIKDKVGYQVNGVGYPFGRKTPVSNEVFFKACNPEIRCGFTMNHSVNLCVLIIL